MTNERDMLMASSPPADAADFAAFEAKFLCRQPDCPPTGEIIRVALGQGGSAEEVRAHLKSCAACRAVHDAYLGGLEKHPLDAAEDPLVEDRTKDVCEESTVPARAAASAATISVFSAGSQSISLTNVGAMFQTGRWEEALELLRPCLPEFLEAVGLDPGRAEEFSRFMQQRLASGQGLPPRGLPGWLEDFARLELGLRALPYSPQAHEWETLRNRCALLTLRESAAEPEATRGFLTHALTQGVRSCEQLELIRLKNPPPRSRISDVECRSLIKRGRKQSKRFAPLFPVTSN